MPSGFDPEISGGGKNLKTNTPKVRLSVTEWGFWDFCPVKFWNCLINAFLAIYSYGRDVFELTLCTVLSACCQYDWWR